MMEKLKKFIFSSKINTTAFIVAVVLLLIATIGVARAAISYYSSGVTMYDIGVTLMENGEKVSWRDYNSSADGSWDEKTGVLLENMIGKGENVSLGERYSEELNVLNSGTINQYVRVSIYKYWGDEKGNKRQDLDPSNIDLNIVNSDYWLVDSSATTTERAVLYYNRLLNSGDETPLFTDTLTIDTSLVNQSDMYDGAKFWIEVHVDVVQENNAEDAILSSWGENVGIDNGSLYLK